MAFIPHAAKGIAQSTSLPQTQAKLDKFSESLNEAIGTRHQDENAWRNSCAQVLDDIASFRSEINAALDCLEAKLQREMKDFHNPVSREIASDLAKFSEIQETLSGYKAELEKAEKSSNESELFVAMKLCQKKLSEIEKTFKPTLEPLRPRLVFTENRSLLQDMEATNMGEIVVETALTNKIHEVSAQKSKNIKLPDDSNTCYIDGLVQMPNGQIIISDKGNKRLKFLDASYNVERYHDVPDKPYALCQISNTEIVVSMANSALLFISIGDTIQNTRSLKVNHKCYGVAYHDNKLFVTDLASLLFIHDMTGSQLQQVQLDGLASGFEIRHLALSANGSRIYVADKQNGLIVLDRNGEYIKTISSPDMKGTRGICVDPHGNVFLACCLSHTVVQVDNKGDKVIKTVARKKNSLHYPGVVLYDKARSCLLVANAPRAGCDSLTVYTMKTK